MGSRPVNKFNRVFYGCAWALLAFTTAAVLSKGAQAQGGGRGIFVAPASYPISSDQQAYDAFASETLIDKKIQLGEEFDLRYPQSSRKADVDDQLVYLYYNRQNWPKFYAIVDIEIKESPNDLAVLRLAGWVIPHVYDPTDPAEPPRLDKAERYEKHALALIAAMKKPSKMTDEDFEQEKVSESAQAHSGLGMAYFRRHEYEKVVSELQAATASEAQQSAQQDLYALGISLQNLAQTADAIDAFTKCSQISGEFQDPCRGAAENPAEEAAFVNFNDEANREAQIKLGEEFENEYPGSRYQEIVQSMLVNLYNNKEDWPAFYAAADKVIAQDPDNAPVLTLVGWVIPHVYEVSEKDAAAKLDRAENYEKHAIELIAAMQLSGNMTPDEFNAAKAEQLARAHDGLGMVYFRRQDYADSARELTISVQSEPDAAQAEFYILGVDLARVGRPRDAADAFTKCTKATGVLRAQCKLDADTQLKLAGVKM
jgi:Tfp pilus assembly protein PilF